MQAKIYRDGANAGWSALIAIGQFIGGDLLIWEKDEGGCLEIAASVAKPQVLRYFDGRKAHATSDFIGVRFSLVFFKVRGTENAPVEVQRELQQMAARVLAWQ